MADRFQGEDDNLRSSLLRSRIAKLPHLPAIAPSKWKIRGEDPDEQREEEDSLGVLDGMAAPPPRSSAQRYKEGSSSTGTSTSRSLDALYSPLSAEDCFEEALEVDIDQNTTAKTRATFRVYYTPSKQKEKSRKGTARSSHLAPDLSNLDTLQSPNISDSGDEEDQDTSGSSDGGTIFFFHHGAGYSGLSYALVAKHIVEQTKGEAGVLALDCRGHGKTIHSQISESEALSLQNLTNDSIAILAKMFPPTRPQPTLILVGHSMGGSVVVSLCHALSKAPNGMAPRVAGVAVLDVVEGSAMAALSSMKTIVSSLPKGFNSVEEAIRWHVDSGTIVNSQSARRSVPSLLQKNQGIDEQDVDDNEKDGEKVENEEKEALEELVTTSPSDEEEATKSFKFIWRANLLATEPYWKGWFQGLSQSFLSVKCARLLLLAGTDRLDTDLMIGQMQGKYQLEVFADVGHSLQEDAPQRTAQTLIDFWRRNQGLNLSKIRGGLRKVGE